MKLKNKPAAATRDVFQHKVAIEQHGLHFGQDVVVPIQIRPARLDHPDLRIREMMHGAGQEIDGRHEIGVENRDDFARRRFEPVLERAGFVALTIGPVDVFDGQPGGLILAHQALSEGMGFVG